MTARSGRLGTMRAMAVVFAVGFFFMPAEDVAAQGPLRLGYIDSQAILAQAPGATEAQDQFERDMARYRAELDQIGEELQGMIQQFEQQQLTLSPQARDTQTQTIQAKQEEYNQRAAELEGEAGRRQTELVQPIMDQVTEAIDQIRTEGGYAIIFDLSAQAIVSADPDLNLTQLVIDRLIEMSTTGNP